MRSFLMNFVIMGTQLVNNFAVGWGGDRSNGECKRSSYLCIFSKGHSLVDQFSKMKLMDPFVGLHTRV